MNLYYLLVLIVIAVLVFGRYILAGAKFTAEDLEQSDNDLLPPEEDRAEKVQTTGKEWPIIAESPLDYEIQTMKARLEAEEIPVVVEIQNPNVTKGAANLLKHRLRVKPDRVREALKLLREEGLDDYLKE